jgi:capsid portal protein
MKKINGFISIFILLLTIDACSVDRSYYEQFTDHKPFISRILDLNKSIEEIRTDEKGKLIKDDINLLKYVYEIGKNDTYIVSYLFDEKGCFEIGIDGYFETEEDANNVVNGIKAEMGSSSYGDPLEGNLLARWNNEKNSFAIELDYKDTSRGLVVATIFANE